MTLIRTAFRTVVATAAASALVVGSAAGVMAKPATKPAKAGSIQIAKIDIKRHSPINVESLDTARDLKLKVTLRDNDASATATAVTVTLAQFLKKSSATPVPVVAPAVPLTLTKVLDAGKYGKKSATFAGSITKDVLVALGVPDNSTALMCISAVDLTIDDKDATPTKITKSAQTKRRLGEGTKKPVRECVRLVNPLTPAVAPAAPAA